MVKMSNLFLAGWLAPFALDDDDNFSKLNLYFELLFALNMFMFASLGLTLLFPTGKLLLDRLLFVLLFFTLLRCSDVMVCIVLGCKLTTTTDDDLLVGEADDDMELRIDGTCWGLARLVELVGLLIMLECSGSCSC